MVTESKQYKYGYCAQQSICEGNRIFRKLLKYLKKKQLTTNRKRKRTSDTCREDSFCCNPILFTICNGTFSKLCKTHAM